MNKKTVGNLIAAAVVCMTGTHAVAGVATDMITSEAVFWFDASALTAAAGTELNSWADVRGGSYPTFTTYTTIKPQVIEIASGPLAGKKAVTFFTVKTACDMHFASEQAIKTAFFVTDIDQSGDAYLLGSGTNFNFARGSGGYGTTASYQYSHSALSGTEYWNDGVKIAAPTTTVIPTGYQLITWHKANGGSVRNMCKDRSSTTRIGGKRLCEVVAFNRSLSDEERSAVEGYLKAKWWGTMSQTTATFAMRVHKFGRPQVHFDASEASSFHYEVAGDATGTLVSQWDDLSGNGRHLVPYQCNASAPMYATRGIIHNAPVLNLGLNASGIDLKLPSRLTTTRAVFMVAEVDRNRRAYWLGDASTYHFARNDNTGEGYYIFPNTPINNNGSIYRNGQKIKSPTTQYPDAPGGLCVYVFNINQNCNWEYLCRDRTGGKQNSGGKRIAELITFDTTFTDADRASLEELLMEKWRPSDAYVDGLIASAPVHVDASSPANFNYADGNITGWKNQGDGADLFKPNSLYQESTVVACQYGAYGFTNGVPAFLMGAAGSKIDLAFTRHSTVRAVFWAMDIQRDANAFFLGDGKNETITTADKYDFCRGYHSRNDVIPAYASTQNAANAFKYGPIFRDGELVVSSESEIPPYGTHVFDVSLQGDLTASSLSQDRVVSARNGGRAISELLIFTNAVSGLTQDAIRERLARKWTTSCGWAGAGDAEWGTDKYRVFGADAAVPAEGAAAAGVGFTANATLSGGTLTLGDGGFFASEGAAVTVSAPVAGKLGVYGPGTVTLTAAPATVDSISVGYGSTLVVAAGTTTATGGLSIQENGKLVIDVSALAARQHATLSFANCCLPAGGTLYDYVSLAGNAAGHFFTVSEDGKTIHVNDPAVAVAAEWNATVSDDVAVAANWLCRNANGETLPNTTLPCFRTMDVVLNAECDLRAWGTPVFTDGARIDLNGNVLRVASLADEDFANAVVTNSNDGTCAELHVDVASGVTTENTSVSINGNVKLVKDGLGTFVPAKKGQGYTGGTLVKEGELKLTTVGAAHDAREHALGAAGSVITVSTNGTNVGVFNMNCFYAQTAGGYTEVLDGGTIRNDSNINDAYGQLGQMTLTADSKWIVNGNCGFFDHHGIASILDLGGHTLAVEAAAGRHLMLGGTTISNGTIHAKSTGAGGALLFGSSASTIKAIPVIATNNVTFMMDCAIAMSLNADVEVVVGNYHALYDGTYNSGTNVFKVFGTFKPAAHNYFYGVTMMNGSTIDLSSRTNALPAVSSFTNGKRDLDFAENAVVAVKLGAWKVPSRSKIISWSADAQPTNVGTVKFVCGDEGRTRFFSKKSDGLYLSGGFMLILR